MMDCFCPFFQSLKQFPICSKCPLTPICSGSSPFPPYLKPVDDSIILPAQLWWPTTIPALAHTPIPESCTERKKKEGKLIQNNRIEKEEGISILSQLTSYDSKTSNASHANHKSVPWCTLHSLGMYISGSKGLTTNTTAMGCKAGHGGGMSCRASELHAPAAAATPPAGEGAPADAPYTAIKSCRDNPTLGRTFPMDG